MSWPAYVENARGAAMLLCRSPVGAQVHHVGDFFSGLALEKQLVCEESHTKRPVVLVGGVVHVLHGQCCDVEGFGEFALVVRDRLKGRVAVEARTTATAAMTAMTAMTLPFPALLPPFIYTPSSTGSWRIA
jgi:hypothetical protein